MSAASVGTVTPVGFLARGASPPRRGFTQLLDPLTRSGVPGFAKRVAEALREGA